MNRREMEKLTVWKSSMDHKPLIIRGARQVGKTWLMKEFGRREFKQTAYVNFESSPALKTLFADDFDIRRILTAIQIESGVTVQAGNTLIILDEIQEAPGGLTALKYFQENAPQYHVLTAGSLLGVALRSQSSFPVGKVEFMDLRPLDFLEFLDALNQPALASAIRNHDWSLVTAFQAKYKELLKQYYYVGGMPEAVVSFSAKTDFAAVRTIQKNILTAYEQDFSKHAPHPIVPRIRMLWNSIPAQLAKENRKFIYGKLRPGARAKDYEESISWLTDCGLIHKVSNIAKPAIPLKAYEDFGVFKIFLVDVGLLSAMVDLDAKTLLEGNSLFAEFKGALTEQYVLQQLLRHHQDIFYWTPENARSEIDFLLQIGGELVPIEVKAEENLRARSLRIFHDRYHPKTSIRTSMSDYRREDWLTNLPLYAIGEIDRETSVKKEGE
ncbi:MAG: ATP-binding protein [Puia sp.]